MLPARAEIAIQPTSTTTIARQACCKKTLISKSAAVKIVTKDQDVKGRQLGMNIGVPRAEDSASVAIDKPQRVQTVLPRD